MTNIDWTSFWIIFMSCALTIFICRVIPLMTIKGKNLPEWVERILAYIPAAVFAALVVNDLYTPDMFEGGLWPGGLPLVASLIVIICAILTKSLGICAIVGIASYIALSLISGII